MKRDMDLIRKLLFYIEENHDGMMLYGVEIEGYSINEIAYHCKLLYDADLIDDYSSLDGDDTITDICVGGLTWEGCNFIDKVRDNNLWHKIKNEFTEKGIPLLISTIGKFADKLFFDKL